MAGFRFIRPDEVSQQQPTEVDPVFFWFFFLLPNQRVAWATTGAAARLTYSAPSRLLQIPSHRSPAASPSSVFRREPVFRTIRSISSSAIVAT
jgi:hypothetical protein